VAPETGDAAASPSCRFERLTSIKPPALPEDTYSLVKFWDGLLGVPVVIDLGNGMKWQVLLEPTGVNGDVEARDR